MNTPSSFEPLLTLNIDITAFREAMDKAVEDLAREDMKRIIEEKVGYRWISFDQPDQLNEIIAPPAFKKDERTFTVILSDNDRREVKAAYMEVDGGALYFEDDNRETILAFGPGHWIWAERVEDDQNT